MAKTLIIKNANFNNNKIETVIFSDPIPCESISLNKSSTTLNVGGTDTITATVLPSNTTDSVVWLSSDSNVATVTNGVITAIGNGSATITAKCGTQTATVSVTTSSIAIFDNHVGYYIAGSASNDSATLMSNTSRTAFGKTGSGLHALWNDAVTREIALTFMPYPIPSNATKLNITVSSKTYVVFTDNTTTTTLGNGGCSVISKESDWTNGDRELTIPEGANSFFISAMTTDPTSLQVKFV